MHIAVKFIAIIEDAPQKFATTIIESIACDDKSQARGYGLRWHITAQQSIESSAIDFGARNLIIATTIGYYGCAAFAKTIRQSLSARVSADLFRVFSRYFWNCGILCHEIFQFLFNFSSSFDNIPQEPVNEHALLSMRKNRRFGE